jgi:hypothetical protein
VRRRLFALAGAIAVACPAAASAAPVLVLGPHGRLSRRQDPFLSQPSIPPASVGPPARTARAQALSSNRTVVSELVRLYRAHRLTRAQYRRYRNDFTASLNTVKRLSGTRAAELEAVVENLHQIAAARLFVPSRLPALFLTLERNRQWWSTGSIPGSGDRIEFSGSQLVWEYYPGQGLELQVLGTFGKADGLYTAGPSRYPDLRQLLSEMIPLAVHRAGGIAWEYYFHFDGGAPPWVSAMAQGTGLEALTRAQKAFGGDYLRVGAQALPLFTQRPWVGVRVRTRLGARYLQYSFAPGTDIINAFLQSLIGLYDYAQASGSPRAWALFRAGDAQARAELPSFDTGAWSLYQPGDEDTLDYHNLVTRFLDELCSRTHARVYCTTATHFHAYLKTPPALTQLTQRAPARRTFDLSFRLSKVAHVGVVVLQGTRTLFETSADFSYGVHAFALPALGPGGYTIHLAGTDLAGNFNRVIGTLTVA